MEDQRTDLRWSVSSVRGCAAAISFFRGKIDGESVFTHDFMKQYLEGTVKCTERLGPRGDVWDASIILRALQGAPFEPMSTVDMKFASVSRGGSIPGPCYTLVPLTPGTWLRCPLSPVVPTHVNVCVFVFCDLFNATG